MSDININGIPNMGFAGAGGGYFGGNAALGIPAMGAAGDFGASKWSQPLYNDIFSKFGQQTDYYSGLGAAYGRQTGGFGAAGSNPGWQTPAPAGGGGGIDWGALTKVPVTSNVWDTGLGGFGGGGGGGSSSYWQDPNAAPSGGANPFDSSTWGASSGSLGGMDFSGGFQSNRNALAQLMQPQQPAANPYAQMFRMPDANPSYFNPGTYGGLGQPYTGQALPGDIGFSKQPSYPNLGYNPGMQNWFANPAMGGNPFQNAFSNFPNSATPSQYTFQPYTNAGGQTFQPNMPQGFSPLYGVDNPEGALPLNWNSSFGPGNAAQPGG
jgi:hypothetical protein